MGKSHIGSNKRSPFNFRLCSTGRIPYRKCQIHHVEFGDHLHYGPGESGHPRCSLQDLLHSGPGSGVVKEVQRCGSDVGQDGESDRRAKQAVLCGRRPAGRLQYQAHASYCKVSWEICGSMM